MKFVKYLMLTVITMSFKNICLAEIEQNQKVDELKEMKRMLNALQNQVQYLQNENEMLKKNMYNNYVEVQGQFMSLNSTINQVSEAQFALDDVTLKALMKSSRAGTPVTFTAHSSGDREYTDDTAQQIIFDRTVVDIGGGYNKDASEFICPYTGIYLFSLSLRVVNGKEMRVSIRVNGSEKVKVFNKDNNHHSNSVAVQCNKGDVVDVHRLSGKTNNVGGGLYTTFSGTMILMYTNEPERIN